MAAESFVNVTVTRSRLRSSLAGKTLMAPSTGLTSPRSRKFERMETLSSGSLEKLDDVPERLLELDVRLELVLEDEEVRLELLELTEPSSASRSSSSWPSLSARNATVKRAISPRVIWSPGLRPSMARSMSSAASIYGTYQSAPSVSPETGNA